MTDTISNFQLFSILQKASKAGRGREAVLRRCLADELGVELDLHKVNARIGLKREKPLPEFLADGVNVLRSCIVADRCGRNVESDDADVSAAESFLSAPVSSPTQTDVLDRLCGFFSAVKRERGLSRTAVVRIGCALLIICAVYIAHWYLTRLHYQRCSANLFRVVFFKKSDFCVQLAYILSAIEAVCFLNLTAFVKWGVESTVTTLGSVLSLGK